MRSHDIIRDISFPAIDGLRFYAAACIVVEHALPELLFSVLGVPREAYDAGSSSYLMRFLVYLGAGDHGVDVFFIISGFLMARIVLRPGAPSYLGFIANRWRRIYPAFFASLLVATAADCLLFQYPFEPLEFAKNLLFLNAIPGAVSLPYNFVSWTLGYEFAFYLFIPVLAVLASVVRDGRIAAVLLLVLAVAFIPSAFMRMWALFLGAVIGSFADADLRRAASRLPLLPLLALYMAVNAAVVFADISYVDVGHYALLLSVAAPLFVKIVWDDRHWLSRLLSQRVMRFFGTISYSIYLYHPTVLSTAVKVLRSVGATPSVTGAVAYLAMAALCIPLVSFASYRLFEQWYFRKSPSSSAPAMVLRA